METLRRCLSCSKYFTQRSANTFRCDICATMQAVPGTEGSKVIFGATTQRELAQMKREFYEVESVVKALDARKAQFIQEALKQADELVRDVEAQIGQPVAELRTRRDMLKTKLQEYMKESGETTLRVRNLLLELKNELVNPGNRPQPTKIYEELRKLADLTKEELQEIIRANYSQPQFGDVLHITEIPRGKGKPTAAQDATIKKYSIQEELSLPIMAEIHKDFCRTAAEICRIEASEGIFIFNGDFVRENGVADMITRQMRTKASLKLADLENREGRVLALVEGKYAFDPNTIRAFLAEKFPTHTVRDALVLEDNRVAVELAVTGSIPAAEQAMDFFNTLEQIIGGLMQTDQARQQIAQGIFGYVSGANQMDLADNTEDLALKYERQNTSPSGTGSSGRPQEGIMSPEQAPETHSMVSTGCAVCHRKLTAHSRDPQTDSICLWCGLEADEAR